MSRFLCACMLLMVSQAPSFAPDGPKVTAYATQVKTDVIIATTFGDVKPVRICVSLYALDDTDFTNALGSHCTTPKSNVGELDVWGDHKITDGNFVVVLSFPDRPAIGIYLVYPKES